MVWMAEGMALQAEVQEHVKDRASAMGAASVRPLHLRGPLSLCLLLPLSICLPHRASATTTITSLDCLEVAGGVGVSSALNGLNKPKGVAVDASGQLFVADSFNHRIMKFIDGSTTGELVAGGNGEGAAANQLPYPAMVLIDGQGNLVVSEHAPAYRVSIWTPGSSSGQTWAEWPGNQLKPHGIRLDAAGDLFVAFAAENSIYSAHKVPKNSNAGQAWSGNEVAQNIIPIDVDFDVDGNVYLLNAAGNGGKWPPTQQTNGATDPAILSNSMLNPRSFLVDSRNHIWVADSGNNRVLKCDDDPNNLVCENFIDSLNEPYGIAMNDEETFFYVSERSGHRVLKCPTGYTTVTTTTSSLTSTTSTTSTSTITTSTSSSSSISSTTSSSTSGTSTTSTSTSSTTTTSSTVTTSSTTTTSSTSSTTSSTSITTSSSSTTTSSYTTTFTTTPRPTFPELPSGVEVVAHLLSEVAGASAKVLELLRQSGQDRATVSIPGGTLAAVRLGKPQSLANSSGDSVVTEIEGEEGPLTVSIPTSVFADLNASSVPEDDICLLVSTFASSESTSIFGGLQTDASGRASKVSVMSATTIDLGYLLSGELPPVNGLQRPIVFQMPGINYTDRLNCAYWKEQEDKRFWSTDKVGAPAEDNEDGRPLVCETYHLSFFAAILEAFLATLECAQFGLMSPDAIKNLFSDSAWLTSPAAWVCWAIFACVGLTFGLATFLDFKRGQSHRWRSEFFLVATATGPEPATGEKGPQEEQEEEETGPGSEEAKPTTKPSSLSRIVTGGVVGTSYCAHCLWESSAFQEAVNEIFSSWFEYWGNVRGACESLYGVVAEGSGVVPTAVVHKLTVTLLMSSSRRLVAASLGVTNDVVAFVLEDEDLQDFLTERPGEANGTASRAHDWKTAEDQRVAWASLHDTVVHHVLHHTGRHTAFGLPRLVLDFFVYHNPVGGLFVHDIFHSCKKRVLLLGVDLMGALAMSCVFFDAAGLVRGKPVGGSKDCEGDGSFAFRIGRFLAIATGSLIVSALPVSIIASFETKGFRKLDYPGSEAWQKQLRVWDTQNTIVWTLSVLYMAFCVFFILVFLASIGPTDQEDWSTSGVIALAEEFALMPFFLALFVPTMTSAFITLHGKIHRMDRATVIRKSHESLLQQSNMMLPVMRV